MSEAHNQFAGQGPVVLDIGDDIGALIVTAPQVMLGAEVEARRVGSPPGGHHPHVAVVLRHGVATLVYPELEQGEYDLHVLPGGAAAVRAGITGGAVTELAWPGAG